MRCYRNLPLATVFWHGDECRKAGLSIELKGGSFEPLSVICLPMRSRYTGVNIFLFGDDKSEDRLSHVVSMLRHVIERMASKLDNISLFQEIQALNRELDLKVEERTRELKESENRFRQFFENEPAYCYMISPDGLVLDVNKSALDILGYRKEDLVGRPFQAIYAPEYLPKMKECFEKWKATGKLSNVETVILSKNGEKRTVLLSANIVRDAEGNLVHSISVQQDITELKATEEELLKLSSAIEQSPVSIVITDANGNIQFVNPKFTQITGYGPDEALGKNPRILKSGKTPPEVYTGLWTAITAGNMWNGTFCNRKKNGDLFWEDATIAPVRNRAGLITHYIAIKEDITEKKLLEDQLRQAQKMEAIGTLAGGVAHDFNNILQTIIGYGNIMKMKMKRDDPQRGPIDQILAASDRAAHLTQGLLAFSRKQVINPKPVDLNDVVKSVEKLLLRLIGEDVELIIRLADQGLIVMADSGQVEQVLMNLATNARDAMPEGGRLNISTEKIEFKEEFISARGFGKPGRYALITVSDTGTGMDEQTRGKIFEPFYTTKELGKGTGLGLSIVYGIIKQHDGNINVYSEPGKGTAFRIYLPLILTEVQEAISEAVVLPVGGTETILLAEDDPEVRKLNASLLRDFGYHVVVAVDGQNALEQYEVHKKEVDLLVLDVIMPKKSGKDVSDAVKGVRPDVPILFISGYTADVIQKKGVFEEGAEFLSKPVSPLELMRKIRQILDAKQPS